MNVATVVDPSARALTVPEAAERALALHRNGVEGRLDLPASNYLRYLPAPYQDDHFMGRFLLIFESILGPIEGAVDGMANYFDPRLTPAEMLPWLASWVGLELDENWPLPRRRELVHRAAWLYRWRGTRAALREHLRIYTGHAPLIVENTDGMRLGQDASLGVNTSIGEWVPNHLSITAQTDPPPAFQPAEDALRRIVTAEKPAHVGYTIHVHQVG